MEDFYQMLHQALKSSRASTAQKRQQVYGRAREMVRNQMARQEPVPDEAEISRIYRSLESEIARIEVQLAETPTSAEKAPPPAEPVVEEDPPEPRAKERPANASESSGGRGSGRMLLLGVICGVAGCWLWLNWQENARNDSIQSVTPELNAEELQREEDSAINRVVDKVERAQVGP